MSWSKRESFFLTCLRRGASLLSKQKIMWSSLLLFPLLNKILVFHLSFERWKYLEKMQHVLDLKIFKFFFSSSAAKYAKLNFMSKALWFYEVMPWVTESRPNVWTDSVNCSCINLTTIYWASATCLAYSSKWSRQSPYPHGPSTLIGERDNKHI